IREVEITGDSGAPSGAPLTITGVSATAQQSGNEAFKTYDGNLGTRWAAEGTQSIQWDLGSAQSVTAFKAAFHQLRHYSFQIDASTNGTTWTSVLSGQTSSGA